MFVTHSGKSGSRAGILGEHEGEWGVGAVFGGIHTGFKVSGTDNSLLKTIMVQN